MRHLGLLSSLCLTATASAAEPPVPYKDYLRQHAETRGFMLGRPVRPRPTPDGKSVLFLRAAPRVPELRLYELDVASKRTRELITPQQILKGAEEDLSQEERARRERMRVSVRGFTTFELSKDGALLLLSLSGRLYLLRRQGGQVTELKTGPTPAIDPKLSPDGKRVAYVRDRDLYVLDIAAQKETRLMASKDPAVSYGLAEFVAQEELHRFSGLFWSPDSARLVFEEADNRGVEVLHISDAAHPERPPAAFSYPRPGKPNAKIRLGVISATGGKPTWIKWDGERLPYVATVRWEEKAPLTLALLDRLQHDLELVEVDERTGQTSRLLAEHDDAWINIDPELPRWLPDGTAFLWSSERSGRWELELRDRKGQLVRALVPGAAGFQGFVALDAAARQVVYSASTDPAARRLFRVSLDGGAATAVAPEDKGPAVSGAVFSKDHSLYVHTHTGPSSMPRTTVHRADGGLIGELESVAEEPPLRPRVELTTVGARGYRAALVRPRGFDKGKKYPVVLHVYGGPGHLQVSAAMQSYLLDQWLADHGFVVVSADGRGTPGRGREWERAIDGNFARVPLADQVEALQELGRRYPELDLSRVGVYGWSFGGYLAALATLQRPDVFHVGVAGAPVVAWEDYDTCYTERYLHLPATNAAGYGDSSLLTHAAKLSRPLLIIHGTGDDNVYFFHSLKLSDALFRAGKPHELLPLSGLTHMVPDAVVTERLWGRILGAFTAALRP